MGKKLGDPANPLLMSVRSGAKFSMPGMMNTILNLGLNDQTVEGLAPRTAVIRASPTIAIAASSRCSAKWRSTSKCSKFDDVFDARKHKAKAKLDTDLSADDLKAVIGDYKKLVQKETRQSFSAGRAPAARHVARCGVPVLVGHRTPPLTAAWKRSRTIWHRRERPGHGVRQYGR